MVSMIMCICVGVLASLWNPRCIFEKGSLIYFLLFGYVVGDHHSKFANCPPIYDALTLWGCNQ